MQCPKCNTDNPESARFCMNCAAPLALVCAKCGTALPPAAKFCFNCAAPVTQPQPTDILRPDATAERLQRLVPKEYAERLLATRGQVAKERRIVTILFSDVKGSTAMAEDLDPEEVMEIMEGAFDVLIEPVYHYEGTLARLMGDAILAFFGAPIAHEDDPERAIRAALEITAGAAEYAEKLEKERGIGPFGVRVGINTGLVVVGEIGSDLRVEYTAMGDAINLAARMEQNAPPGGILITHDTYRHVRGVFDVLPQELLQVKGKREPVQTYLVQQAKPRAFRKPVRGVEGIETRMIGRQAELNRLQEAFFTAMEDRELQMVTVVGEAGVGKSRLLHEFDLWAELLPEQFYYFKGRALQEVQSLPYALIRDLFAFRFQIEDSHSLPEVREKWEQGIHSVMGRAEDTQMRAHFIGHLLGFEQGSSPHLEAVRDDPRQLRDRALTYLVDYFQALAAQDPVLILLEDLHWADDSSLDTLNHLALALTDQPLMIISASRPALFERRPHWGEGQPFHRRLPLEPLTKRNTRRLLDEILQKVDQVPDTLSELVVAGAEGNPFFVEELVKMLLEDGIIIKGQDQWRVDPSRLTEVRVPPTLRGVLQARLDRLPLEERTVLQQAAVVGRLFWDRAVLSIHQAAAEAANEAEVLDSLSALRSREMVFHRETTAFAGAQEYIFQHAALREVTYKSLLKRLRRIYHGLVADWLMEQTGERAGEYTGLIADHLELAGRGAEAVDYLVETGDRARGVYASQEAVNAYQRALALLRDQGNQGRAARMLMKLGLTYHSAFDFHRSHEAYKEAFTIWGRIGETPDRLTQPAAHPLRIGRHSPVTLDTSLALDDASAHVIAQLFSGLVEVTPENDIVPSVASSWEVSEGGRRYVFRIRDDVRWSDGAPVRASDFVFAWKRVLDPATASPVAQEFYAVQGARDFHWGLIPDPDKVGIRAIDDLTLEVQLEAPTGHFLHMLGQTFTYPVPRQVVQAHSSAWTLPQNIVVNGPFLLQSWQRGESMVLVHNPQYHGRFRGNVRQVDLSFSRPGEWAAQLQKYEAGALDIVSLDQAPPQVAYRARQAHAGEYVPLPAAATLFLDFDVTRPPFDDRRVRQAFALSLDREALVEKSPSPYHLPATGGFVPPDMPGHTPGIAPQYDAALARQLLAEAGYPSGRGFPGVDIVTWPRAEQHAAYLQAQWRDALGVVPKLDVLEWAEFLTKSRTDPPHMSVICWIGDYPDPDSFLRVALRHHTRWQHAAYDELIEQATRVMDQRERMNRYRQAERILMEEAPIVPLCYEQGALLVKPWIRKLPVSAFAYLSWKDTIIDPH